MNTACNFLTLVIATLVSACATVPRTVVPGPMADGRTMLPNGWMLSPAGDQLELGDLPLNMALSPDGRYVLFSGNQFAMPFRTEVSFLNGRSSVLIGAEYSFDIY